MARRGVRFSGAAGLHARPAAELVRVAQAHPGGIRIIAGGVTVDAASILSVMALTLGHGEEVVLEADGPDAPAALDVAARLL